jgi:hypothetical protein
VVWVGQALHGHGVGQHGGWAHFLKPCFHEDKTTKSIDNPHWPSFFPICIHSLFTQQFVIGMTTKCNMECMVQSNEH